MRNFQKAESWQMLQRSNGARLAEDRLRSKTITVTGLQQTEIAGDSGKFTICA